MGSTHATMECKSFAIIYQGRNGQITDLRVNSTKHAFIYMLSTISLDDTKFIISLGSSFFIASF